MKTLSVLAIALSALTANAETFEAKQVDAGIAVSLAISGELTDGSPVGVEVKLADQTTGAPLRRVYPAAWIGAVRPGATGDRKQCAALVARYLSADFLSPTAVDLNVYHVITLNADPSITVVDPRFEFGGSRLLAAVGLRAPGHDWALSPDGAQLFVSMPAAGEVAVIDTAAWTLIANVAVGAKPTRVAIDAEGENVWIATAGGVTALRVRDRAVAARIDTGRGPHDLAAGDGTLFVTNGDDSVTLVDTRKLRATARIAVAPHPVSIAWSPLSRMAYAASSDGTIAVLDPATGKERTRIAARPGLRQIRFAPGGRYAFVPNPEKNILEIIDAASSRVVQSGTMENGPYEVTFTDTLAYVRHLRSEIVLMVPLAEVGTSGKALSAADFPAGQAAFGATPVDSPADGVVRTPGENGVLVAHPADKAVYFYREGMAAPMGHFETYGHVPQAVLVVDRTLREREPGRFRTTTRLPRAGTYNVGLFLDSPRVTSCFEVTVKPSALTERAPLIVEQLGGPRVVPAGSSVRVGFRLIDPATHAPLDGVADASLFAWCVADGWSRHAPLAARGGGRYEADLVLPSVGVYYVYFQSKASRSATYIVFEAQPVGAGS